jgi:hypothetical protein
MLWFFVNKYQQQSNTGYEWVASQSIEDVLNSWIGGETYSFTRLLNTPNQSQLPVADNVQNQQNNEDEDQ